MASTKSSAAADAAEHFRSAMLSGDQGRIAATLSGEVAFHSPAFADPAVGRETVAAVLATAAGVYGGMDFGETLTATTTAALFFEAEVAGLALQACYRLEVSPDTVITRVDALMRPLAATQALVDEMMRRVGR